MQPNARRIEAHQKETAGKVSHQITYELGNSRRTLNTSVKSENGETSPHGAGSFHDPEHHFKLLDRVEALLRSH
ncbi:MAG: hypothetical protein GWO81_07175 [Verrucomicrobia bacterium]|nr:hypothetical protein [Verrucomicrobiota bacterium]